MSKKKAVVLKRGKKAMTVGEAIKLLKTFDQNLRLIGTTCRDIIDFIPQTDDDTVLVAERWNVKHASDE